MCVKTIAPEFFAEDVPETGNFTGRREDAEKFKFKKQKGFCFSPPPASSSLRVTTFFPLNFGVQNKVNVHGTSGFRRPCPKFR
jgi:hypothetical protein